MPFNLPQIAKRQGMRRSKVVRDIAPPAILATDLYQSAYLPVVDIWSDLVTPIMGEYARSLSALTTDAASDLDRYLAIGDQRATSVYLLLTQRVNTWAVRVESWHRQKWRAAVLSASRVDLGTLLGPEAVRATLETTIATNTGLIRNVSDQARQRIGQAVFDGLRNRTSAVDVAKSVREAVEMGRARSKRVAADQLAKLTGALADERRREAGIMTWEWKHSGKRHPRAEHVARDGKVYSDSPADVGGKVMGKTIAAAPNDRPSQLPYCGCRSLSVIEI